ncbi:N-acetyltransferase [Burkholderia sp. Bp9126]|nr:N-acetyltransferase [Burkholderia sp. Bp9126]
MLASIETRLESMEDSIASGRARHLLAFDKDDDRLVGECHFTQLAREPFLARHLGFSIAHDREGQGLMRECLEAAIRHVFGELGRHRGPSFRKSIHSRC